MSALDFPAHPGKYNRVAFLMAGNILKESGDIAKFTEVF